MMTFEDLANGIILPGCPEYLVREALLQGAQQFARDTLIWEEVIEASDVTGAPVAVKAPFDAAIVRITRVTVDGQDVDYAYTDGAIDVGDATGRLEVRAALEPTETDMDVPDALAPWKHAIQAYARAELLTMEGQEWTDLNAATVRMTLYTQRVTDARMQRATGQTTQPLRVSPPPLV